MPSMALFAGVEEAALSPEEQLAALQTKLSVAKGPPEGAALPDGSELGASTLGRTYAQVPLQQIFSDQSSQACSLSLTIAGAWYLATWPALPFPKLFFSRVDATQTRQTRRPRNAGY